MIAKFVRALLLVVGILIALQAVGIDLTLLTVFGGALGVGIGLGLQKLASNYIAGFTILLDRSIRLGDMITVDNRFGVVAKVTSRYVVVRSLDGVEAIVPNETLVTTTVLNHSYTNREVRVGHHGAGELRQRHRARLEADGSGRQRRVAGVEDAERAGGVRRPLRRQRHRARAGRLDQRSGKRPAQSQKRDQPAHLDVVSRERHQDPLRAREYRLVAMPEGANGAHDPGRAGPQPDPEAVARGGIAAVRQVTSVVVNTLF